MAKKMPKGLANIKMAMEMSPKDIEMDKKTGGKETKIEAKEYAKKKVIKKKC